MFRKDGKSNQSSNKFSAKILGINITLTSSGVGPLCGRVLLIMSIGTVVYRIAVPLFDTYYSTIVSTVKR